MFRRSEPRSAIATRMRETDETITETSAHRVKGQKEERMSRHFPIVVEQDVDGVYIVECPVF